MNLQRRFATPDRHCRPLPPIVKGPLRIVINKIGREVSGDSFTFLDADGRDVTALFSFGAGVDTLNSTTTLAMRASGLSDVTISFQAKLEYKIR